MIKELVHDVFFLGQKSEPATRLDLPIAEDLEDTLKAHHKTCVGMAANMIGALKCIICFYDADSVVTMLNPQIVQASFSYQTKEGCLSLLGNPRETKRYQKIKVRYETKEGKVRLKTYTGFTAQIIQHEIDHTNGILI